MAARRVTVVSGPRQSGKTTLVAKLAPAGTVRFLDDPGALAAALADPSGFVAYGERPLVIDEVQLGGESLIRAIKAQVDQDSSPGQFVLTGSSNFLTVPGISESLAGRAAFVEVWPFTQGELAGRADRFVDVVFAGAGAGALAAYRPTGTTRAGLLDRLCAGGYPEVHALPADMRSAWFRDYVRTTIERDVVALSGIRKVEEFRGLLGLLAARTGCVLVMERLIADSALARQSVYDHRAWLETVHLVATVPAWSRNLTGRVTQSPKVFVTDSGLAAWLVGKTPAALADPLEPSTGQLVETFVAAELRRQLTWSAVEARLFHWRDSRGAEVDLILEAGDGRVVGVEVKSGQSPARSWFRHLELLRDKVGPSMIAGVVLYAGDQVLPFGDRLWAIPIPALWEL